MCFSETIRVTFLVICLCFLLVFYALRLALFSVPTGSHRPDPADLSKYHFSKALLAIYTTVDTQLRLVALIANARGEASKPDSR